MRHVHLGGAPRRMIRLTTGIVLAAGGALPAQKAPKFNAEIRWTSYGIPHVKANDWGSLGYGFAYATANDAVCTIARDVVMVSGELSRHFGPADGSRESDVFHRAVLGDTVLRAFTRGQSATSNRFADGYVAGYNRYPARPQGNPAGRLPRRHLGARADGRRRDAADHGVGIRYGLGRFQKEMAPPPAPQAAVRR